MNRTELLYWLVSGASDDDVVDLTGRVCTPGPWEDLSGVRHEVDTILRHCEQDEVDLLDVYGLGTIWKLCIGFQLKPQDSGS